MDDTTRIILHLDLDAFFCAVEEQRDPTLKGVPFAVGAPPEQRGVVASCSYAARVFGVHSALPMSRAVRLCPDLRIVPHHFDLYRAASRRVMALLHELTPLVEQLSIDEAFLDVTAFSSDGAATARTLQARINHEIGLPCSLGVASNKLVAKIANNLGKARLKSDQPPNAIEVVPPGEEARYLAPLAVIELWGVGPRTSEQLARLGVQTIGDLAGRDPEEMAGHFGKHGREMVLRARGIDDRPVITEHETKSISRETTFTRDQRDPAALRQVLQTLAADVAQQLQSSQLRGRTVQLKLRWGDFTTITRQTTLPQPTDDAALIFTTAAALLERVWSAQRAARLIGVGISGFDGGQSAAPQVRQLGLWEG